MNIVSMNKTEFTIGDTIPIHLDNVPYDRKLTRKSHRERKRVGVLECGNAGVVFQLPYTKDLYQELVDWWEEEYFVQGELFNVELYTDLANNIIELRFFQEVPFYKPKERHSDSIVDKIYPSVLGCYEKLGAWIKDAVIGVYVSDWDFLEPADIED